MIIRAIDRDKNLRRIIDPISSARRDRVLQSICPQRRYFYIWFYEIVERRQIICADRTIVDLPDVRTIISVIQRAFEKIVDAVQRSFFRCSCNVYVVADGPQNIAAYAEGSFRRVCIRRKTPDCPKVNILPAFGRG